MWKCRAALNAAQRSTLRLWTVLLLMLICVVSADAAESYSIDIALVKQHKSFVEFSIMNVGDVSMRILIDVAENVLTKSTSGFWFVDESEKYPVLSTCTRIWDWHHEARIPVLSVAPGEMSLVSVSYPAHYFVRGPVGPRNKLKTKNKIYLNPENFLSSTFILEMCLAETVQIVGNGKTPGTRRLKITVQPAIPTKPTE